MNNLELASNSYGTDVFMDMAASAETRKSLEYFKSLKYKTVPVSEISKIETVGSALLVDNPELSMADACRDISRSTISIYMQPAQLVDKLKPLFDDPYVISNKGNNGVKDSLIFKQDDITILDDQYGNYIDIHYAPTMNKLYMNSMVGRYVCTNGATVQVSSRVPHWMTIDIEDVKSMTSDEVVDKFRIYNKRYTDTLRACYESMAKIKMTKADYINKIVPTAVDAVSPLFTLTELDRKVLQFEDPDKLRKLEAKSIKSRESRELIRAQLIENYEKNDPANFTDSLYRAFLALSDAETHGQFKRAVSGYNAFCKGLALTSAILRMSGYRISANM